MQILYLAPKPFADKARRIPYRKKQSAVHYNGLPFIEATENLLSFVILRLKIITLFPTNYTKLLQLLDFLYIMKWQIAKRGERSWQI